MKSSIPHRSSVFIFAVLQIAVLVLLMFNMGWPSPTISNIYTLVDIPYTCSQSINGAHHDVYGAERNNISTGGDGGVDNAQIFHGNVSADRWDMRGHDLCHRSVGLYDIEVRVLVTY